MGVILARASYSEKTSNLKSQFFSTCEVFLLVEAFQSLHQSPTLIAPYSRKFNCQITPKDPEIWETNSIDCTHKIELVGYKTKKQSCY